MGKRKFNSKQGFSLVELALGLAIVAVLILAVSASAGMRETARAQSAARSVQTLRSAAENYLATGKLNYAGMTVDTLKTSKLLPDGFNALKTNPWGGDFAVTANTANNTRFDIALNGLLKADADRMTAFFSNSANAIAFDESKTTWTATF